MTYYSSMTPNSSRILPWLALLSILAAAVLFAGAAFAQVTDTGSITFTIAEEEYGVVVATVEFDEVSANGISSISRSNAPDDYLFQILGPTAQLTSEVQLRISAATLPVDWSYVDIASSTPSFDEVRLLYEASLEQTGGVYEVSTAVGIPTANSVTIAGPDADAPRGMYGGTLSLQVGPRQLGGGGAASLQLSVTVVPSDP